MSIEKSIAKYEGRDQTLQTNTGRVGALVGMAAANLRNVNSDDDGIRGKLSDMGLVKMATDEYLMECASLGVLPTVRGVAGKLGLTRQTLYHHAKRNPDSQFAQWLEEFSDLCGELTMQAALEGSVNVVAAIFTAKARFGWRDNFSVEITNTDDPLGERASADAIIAKWSDVGGMPD